VETYRWWLDRFLTPASNVTPPTVRQFFVGQQHLSASRQHQAYRTLKTFFRWTVEVGSLQENPFRGFTMRTPKTLSGTTDSRVGVGL
jgi:site-specific recombinase XerD